MSSANRWRTIAAFKSLVFLVFVKQGISQECAANGDCDSHERCPVWKDEGECYRSPLYMKRVCPVSCYDMKQPPRRNECKDTHESCHNWSKDAECETNNSVKKYCPLSCGRCTNISENTSSRKNEARDAEKDSARTVMDETNSCKDDHENCAGWADAGECETNPNYMLNSCRKSCGQCKTVLNKIEDDSTALLSRTAKFGVVQSAHGNLKEKTLDKVKSMLDYMEKSDDYLSLPTKIRNNCQNNNELCSFWAALDECKKNMAFMKIQCAPACQTCHLIDISTRCPKLPDAIPALKPGDLNSIFQRIVDTAPGNRTLTDEDRRLLATSEMTEYSVSVHSGPSDYSLGEVNIGRDKNDRPWIITLDNFLTDKECDSMIQHGFDVGYKRSEDVGAQKFDGTVDSTKSKGRTSENAWCTTRNGCREDVVPKRILDRMSNIMGIPPQNSEDLQILKYEVGQFYNTHHDYIPHQKTRQCGPRILTFFLYLSDVEAGGGTDFPDLGVTVTPKKGRAVLWPSVYNSEPINADMRMRHQALPVNAGLKFGANAWIHMFDYQAPQLIGCN